MRRMTKQTLSLTAALSAVGLVALLLVLAVGVQPVAQAAGSPPARRAGGTTIKVPDDYATIQAAINAADDGDTILVAKGVYAENLSVTEGITLSGGWDTTFTVQKPGDSVIDGQGVGRVISITCPSSDTVVTVDGFEMEFGNATGLGGAPATLSAAGRSPARGASRAPDPLTPTEHLDRLRTRLAGAVEQGLFPGGPAAYQALVDRVEAQVALLEETQTQPRPAKGTAEPGGDCGGGLYSWNASLHLLNSTIYGSVASLTDHGCGGGAFVGRAARSGTFVRGNVFQENVASSKWGALGQGGGLYLYQTPGAVVEDNTFDQNGASAAGVESGGFGGGLAVEACPAVVMRGNELRRNTANAGWEAQGGLGGGAYLSEVDGATVDDNHFLENLAIVHGSCGGGGLYLEYSHDVLITDNEVAGNWACMFQQDGDAAGGGGIALYSNESITVTGNLIRDNTTTVSGPYITFGTTGGGLDAQKLFGARIADNTFTDNLACATGIGRGGGVSLEAAHQVEVVNNTIAGNVGSLSAAEGAGGGLFLLPSEGITVRHNRFQDNLAGTDGESQGGGLCAWKEGSQGFDLTVEANLFLNNQASPDANPNSIGGAGFIWVEELRFTNNVVAGNSAAEGGGLDLSISSLAEVTNNTLTSNGDIGLFAREGTPITLTNNIVVSHTVGISVTAGATATVRYTLWDNNGTDIAGAGTISHTHPVSGDPGFARPADDDYHLTADSAAIDAGDPAGVPPAPPEDYDGVARPQGRAVDIGAYEWPGYLSYLPLVAQLWGPAVGWVVGDKVDGYGTILHTTDGGVTWVRQGKPGEIPDANMSRVSAIDAQNAWVVGGKSTILRTRNGGSTWQLQTVPAEVSEAELDGIYAVDHNTAWAAGTLYDKVSQGVILHTGDGGQTWTQQAQDTVPPAKLEGVYASDTDHAWVVGSTEPVEGMIILRTTDAGANWDKWTVTSTKELTGGHLIDIHGVDANTVWTVGTAMVLHTPDGGRTWLDQTMDFSGYMDCNGVFAVDASTVWVVADSGGLYRSDDGGAHWTTQDPPDSAQGDYIMRVNAVCEKTAWAVSQPMPDNPPPPGHILHTADGGQTWIAQTTPVTPAFSGVSFVR